MSKDYSNASLLELFRMEADQHSAVLNDGLVALSHGGVAPDVLAGLMRAAHSLKGAARVVGLNQAVGVAHAMEDCFVAAQENKLTLRPEHVEVLLRGTDFLVRAGRDGDGGAADAQAQELIGALQVIKSSAGTSTGTAPKVLADQRTAAVPAAPADVSGMSLLDLFRAEVEANTKVLTDGLPKLAAAPSDEKLLAELRRAAHSIKGAARIVNVEPAARAAVALEDAFNALIEGKRTLTPAATTTLLSGAELLARMGREIDGNDAGGKKLGEKVATQLAALQASLQSGAAPVQTASAATLAAASAKPARKARTTMVGGAAHESSAVAPAIRGAGRSAFGADTGPRAVRVNAASLSRLMGLAGEAMIDAGWLQRYEKSLRRLQDKQFEMRAAIERLEAFTATQQIAGSNGGAIALLHEVQQRSQECQELLAERMHAFEAFALRSDNLSHRLYREVIASRMRPFGDGVQAFPRLVHDLARSLGKKIRFEIVGKNTQVDRDILEKLEAPLNHLLRNSVDHGIEPPSERVAAGKDEQGRIVLEAVHKGGMLFVTVTDDGRGIDIERVRKKVVERKMTSADMASRMTDAELLEFLFLPGFSTAEKVTEISGRGVGLDVVATMVQEVSGQVRVTADFGRGCTFHVQLPITLSVLNALLVDIGGEPYAFPLTRIERVLKINKSEIQTLENHQFFKLDGQSIGLVSAQQVLELGQEQQPGDELAVVVIGGRSERYGLAVDRILGERNIVVRPLDRRLGKVPNISAAALTEDGAPLLIVDLEDMFSSIAKLLSGGRLKKITSADKLQREEQKRILIVDDSLTVREVERKLLENKGYAVEVAADGAEGWNALRSGDFNLVISDVDMPRVTGIELVTMIRADARFKDLPVMIVSYKDREEDRLRGMEAGANYYLTKSSFHDESLISAVVDLIGEAR